MRLFEGILGVIYSLSIMVFSIIFFDFRVILEFILTIWIFVVAILILIPSLKNILEFIKSRKSIKNGIKTKAKILKIKRSFFGLKSKTRYVLEILYFNPKTSKECRAFIDYKGDNYSLDILKNKIDIDICIDPKNSRIVLME